MPSGYTTLYVQKAYDILYYILVIPTTWCTAYMYDIVYDMYIRDPRHSIRLALAQKYDIVRLTYPVLQNVRHQSLTSYVTSHVRCPIIGSYVRCSLCRRTSKQLHWSNIVRNIARTMSSVQCSLRQCTSNLRYRRSRLNRILL